MTDQALLARAAKAIGGRLLIAASGRLFGIETKKGCRFPWNPLLDNGDAFELAVELRICTLFPMDGDRIKECGAGLVGGDRVASMEPFYPDPPAALRRAIVRAAAETMRATR